jgi:ribosome biogenesis GTPase A
MVSSSKYWKMNAGIMKHSDIILEVIDARCPFLTRNYQIENIAKSMDKKLIIVLNKTDLVSIEFAKEIKKEIEKEYRCAFVSSIKKQGTKFVRDLIQIIKKDEAKKEKINNKNVKKTNKKTKQKNNTIEKNKEEYENQKTTNNQTNLTQEKEEPKEKFIEICVVGYPNVGKSSLINSLKGKRSAKTSPIPGHTKKEQWVRLSRTVRLSDVPGVIHQKEKLNFLKGVATIKESKDIEEDVIDMLTTILEYNNNLKDLYGQIDTNDGEIFLNTATLNRNYVKKKGKPDTKRLCTQIVNDWNKGRIKAEITQKPFDSKNIR